MTRFSKDNQPSVKGTTHHNYNRAQSPKTRFAGKLNWYLFQVKAARGNLGSSGYQILSSPQLKELKTSHQVRLTNVILRAHNIVKELEDLAQEIAELNSPDKWAE